MNLLICNYIECTILMTIVTIFFLRSAPMRFPRLVCLGLWMVLVFFPFLFSSTARAQFHAYRGIICNGLTLVTMLICYQRVRTALKIFLQ